MAVVVLPLGMHLLDLVVSDGWLTATNGYTVEVISTAKAARRLETAVGVGVSRSEPLLATLSAALASIDRRNPVSAINQLLAFENKVSAQTAPLDPVLAASFIQAAQDVIAALSGGNTNPSGRPHGRFESIVRQPDGRVQLQLSREPGRLYILEASTNLVDWEMIGVADDHGDGTFGLEDPNGGKFPSRFYRVQVR